MTKLADGAVVRWILPGRSAPARAFWLQRIWRRVSERASERRRHQSNSATLVRHTRLILPFAHGWATFATPLSPSLCGLSNRSIASPTKRAYRMGCARANILTHTLSLSLSCSMRSGRRSCWRRGKCGKKVATT
ncbi:hypothetical protein K456DRAFT_659574 [Colletotrichum gloeosporioides 23]|nr:hypothetical protein K456DRAFT_659574 [Colletotrichum gloeosporioides 23]